MTKVVDTLAQWARRTTSSFAELRSPGAADSDAHDPADELIYRLRQWPRLPQALRTAHVLRLLSLMSNRPVNRSWMLNHSRLAPERIDQLLQLLLEQQALEVIDPSAFRRQPAPAR